jgi:hypothetical protein
LGAHIVGPYAKEQINIFALAIQRGITSEDLKEIIFAYPTGSSDIAYMLEINNERKPLTLYSWKVISLANE